jgi:hypothetical protein
LHRFCVERCDLGRGGATVRIADGVPGAECQIDFAEMGLVYDPGSGRRQTAHALIFTAVFSWEMFVWLAFAQTFAGIRATHSLRGCGRISHAPASTASSRTTRRRRIAHRQLHPSESYG